MDILGNILMSVVGGAAAQAGHTLYNWLKQYLNDAFKDKSDRDLALRPEFTASIVRFYVAELRNLPKPIKVYSVGNVFRYEEPQKGRYREFTQFNAEIIGAPALQGDAEVIALAIECRTGDGLRVHAGSVPP